MARVELDVDSMKLPKNVHTILAVVGRKFRGKQIHVASSKYPQQQAYALVKSVPSTFHSTPRNTFIPAYKTWLLWVNEAKVSAREYKYRRLMLEPYSKATIFK